MAGCYLAFDFGLRRIGVAVGQPLTGTASPLPALLAQDGKPDWDRIKALLEEWRPRAVVVGVPYNADGSTQDMTARAERFQRQLEGRFGIQVFGEDERFSSVEAEERLREARQQGRRGRIAKTDIDSAAACILLESWLSTRGNTTDDDAPAD